MLHISSPSARAVLTCGQVFLINCISDDDTVHVRDLLNIWYIIVRYCWLRWRKEWSRISGFPGCQDSINFKICCFFEVAFVPVRKSSEHPTNVITIVQFCQQWPFAEQPLYLWKSKHLNWPVHSQKTSQWLISGNCCLKTVPSSSFSLQAGRLKAIQISQSLVFSWCDAAFILPEAGIGANKSLRKTLTLCKLQWSN